MRVIRPSKMEIQATQLLNSALNRNLIFIHGKGGVGKTSVSQAIALCLSNRSKKTLWVTLEDPTLPLGELTQKGPHLWHLNCDFTLAFEEYASIKIGIARLTQLFLKNKLMRYLAKAAPGIHELVLLGKIWYERLHYDHVVVDMPSTGYGLALFQSAENFSKLFKSGPLYRDAEAMLESFRSQASTGHVIVALPEETPLRESLELSEFLVQLFPKNAPLFIANRLFPQIHKDLGNPSLWPSPVASSTPDFIEKRCWLENYNLRLWRDPGIIFGEIDYVPPPPDHASAKVTQQISDQLINRHYL